jgi:hypothetical protein
MTHGYFGMGTASPAPKRRATAAFKSMLMA